MGKVRTSNSLRPSEKNKMRGRMWKTEKKNSNSLSFVRLWDGVGKPTHGTHSPLTLERNGALRNAAFTYDVNICNFYEGNHFLGGVVFVGCCPYPHSIHYLLHYSMQLDFPHSFILSVNFISFLSFSFAPLSFPSLINLIIVTLTTLISCWPLAF